MKKLICCLLVGGSLVAMERDEGVPLIKSGELSSSMPKDKATQWRQEHDEKVKPKGRSSYNVMMFMRNIAYLRRDNYPEFVRLYESAPPVCKNAINILLKLQDDLLDHARNSLAAGKPNLRNESKEMRSAIAALLEPSTWSKLKSQKPKRRPSGL